MTTTNATYSIAEEYKQMTPDVNLDWPHIEAALNKLGKQDFIQLLQQLTETSEEVATFLAARFDAQKSREAILTPYREIITRSFFPDDDTPPDNLDFTESRRAINNYRLATGDTPGVLDLLLHLAEIVVASVRVFGGPYDGSHYDDLGEALVDFVDLLCQNKELYPLFAERIREFRKRGQEIGLDHGDYAIDYLYDMEINLDEQAT